MDELELLVFKEFVKGKIQTDKLELDIRGFYKIGRFQMKQLQIIGKKILSELDKKDKIIDKLAFALADYVMYYEYDKCRNPEMIKYKAKEQIEYFTNKVEEDK